MIPFLVPRRKSHFFLLIAATDGAPFPPFSLPKKSQKIMILFMTQQFNQIGLGEHRDLPSACYTSSSARKAYSETWEFGSLSEREIYLSLWQSNRKNRKFGLRFKPAIFTASEQCHNRNSSIEHAQPNEALLRWQ